MYLVKNSASKNCYSSRMAAQKMIPALIVDVLIILIYGRLRIYNFFIFTMFLAFDD